MPDKDAYIGRLEAARIVLTAALRTVTESLPDDGTALTARLRQISAEALAEAWAQDSKPGLPP